MSEYNQYVDAVNKIFEHITNLKVAIIDQDNLSAIENIESYKQIVIDNAEMFSNSKINPSEVVNAKDEDLEDVGIDD